MTTINTASSSPWELGAATNTQSGGPVTAANYRQKVEEAARGFETTLVRQMLREMRNSSFDPDKQKSINTGYTDMVDDQVAAMITKGKGLGFASKMTEQLLRQADMASQIKAKN
jgi:Rod binding domain-containing protein